MSDPIIGRVWFLGGADRDVYQGADGRRYVLGYEEDRVPGVWLLTTEIERRTWSRSLEAQADCFVIAR